MVDDEIIAEVRKARDELAAKFNYDMDLIFKEIKRQEAASGRKFVRLPKKSKSKVTPTTTMKRN